MEYGPIDGPGKSIRDEPAIVNDKNKCLRLEMPRDHPRLVQNSRYHTQGWRANGDISVILSKSDPNNPSVDEILSTERYVSGYACKGNQPTGAVEGLFQDLVNSANDNESSVKSLVMKTLVNSVKRDVSAVEACFEISSLPLYRCSHTFQSVSLSGSRLLEASEKGEIQIKCNALDRYLQRDPNQKMTFYDHLCQNNKVPVITGTHILPTWPLSEDYARAMLLLHFPDWRKFSDIKSEKVTWTETLLNFLKTPECPNFLKAAVEKAKQKQPDVSENLETGYEDEEENQPDWMELVRPLANFDMSISELQFNDGGEDYNWNQPSYNYPETASTWTAQLPRIAENDAKGLNIPDIDLGKMNEDQLLVFNMIMKSLSDHTTNLDNFKPLRLVVAGTAGCGKSFLIRCLMKAIRLYYNDNNSVQVLCPTGNSAHVIDGLTYHSFLKIPTTNRGKEMNMPGGKLGETLQKNCEGLKVLLFDERSMIGATSLCWIEFMCLYGVCSGKNSDKSWGGLPVVAFFGDNVQLPPVLDCPVYFNQSKSPAAIHGVLVWQEFSNAITLQKVVRQSEEENDFKNVLFSLREYKVNKDQAKWLQKFQWHSLEQKYGQSLLSRLKENAFHVFPTHDQEMQHNKEKISALNLRHPVTRINAINIGAHAKKASNDD